MHHDVSGVVAIDKPAGVTSRRVVDVVAKALGTRAVGHAGTLDPLARGVVVVCAGHATRLVDFIHQLPKRYEATYLLGRSSPSDDLETPVSEEPEPVRPGRAEIEAALPAFRGAILQRPCDYSAVHVDGKRAYALARKGREVVIGVKEVRIDRLEITGYEWPRLDVEMECSSGTFVRAVGRDLAAVLETTAVMASLVRASVGPFARSGSLPLDRVDPASVRGALLPPLAAVGHLPRMSLGGAMLEHAIRGGLLDCDQAPAPAIAACDDAGELLGVLQRHESGRYRLRPNFRGAG